MASETRSFEKWPDVLLVSQTLLAGGRWEFAEIELTEIRFFGGHGRPSGGDQAKNDQSRDVLHGSIRDSFLFKTVATKLRLH